MSRGYPDFFGYSSFPFQGPTYYQSSGVKVVAIGSTETLISIANKGVIISGSISLWTNTAESDAELRLTIDGSLILLDTPNNFLTDAQYGCIDHPIAMKKHDIQNHIYLFNIRKGASFGYEWILEVENIGANDFNALATLAYNIYE